MDKNVSVLAKIGALVVILIPLGVGYLSSVVSPNMRAGFDSMKKPPLSPPGMIFPIVWTILYLLMGIALYMVITSNVAQPKLWAIIAFAVQLGLNFGWSYIFFNKANYVLSVVWILALLAMILLTIMLFKGISKWAAIMLIPYCVWTCFATYLTIGFAVLN